MKRFICAALALLMLAALAACGSGSKDADASTKNDPTAEPTEAPTPEPTEAPTPEPTEAPTPEPTEAPTPEPTAPSDGAISSDDLFGTIDGDVYESRFLGIGCRLEGWHYLTQEEIATTYNMAKYLYSDDVTELLENSPSTTIMSALEPVGGMRNINITLQNTELSFGDYLSEEQIIDIMMPILENTLAQAGYEDLAIERQTVTFLGAEKACITVTGKLYGFDILQKMVFQFHDKYAAYITFTGMNGSQVDDLIAAFYAVV